MRRLVIGLMLIVGACGPSQAQTPASPSAANPTATATVTPGASPTPNPSGPLVFAVLEAKVAGSPFDWNTVAIVGLDGYAKAKTTFTPMPVPTVPCAGAVLPPSAHVAAGKVYFADGTGVVRSLSASGQIARLATFPFSGHQQMLSFAVSPDGSQLLGAVFTLPAKPTSWCGTPELSGYSLDVYSAKAGGSSTLLYHKSLPATGNVMALFGWDNVGPFGTYPTVWASQGGGPGSTLGVLVRIDASTGKVLGEIGGAKSCGVWEMAFSGDYACAESTVINSAGTYDGKVSVRRVDGSEIWHATLTTNDGLVYLPQLAPDEAHVAVGANSATVVVGRTGSQIKIGFFSSGWLNSSTLIGDVITASPNPNLAYVGLSAPGTVISLGFPGLFVGTVQT
jgi:WD40 repeat protein